ncbi:branched-chain amino acid transport system II carrier protein [Anaerosphaera multitolerans]|uniref:Branched-chain amino acid transport system carrier protein n=1 Tax=Anaerosphaera multitolerans TaxID=2487351 RepID=A0A437S5E9_9FIRM|nr:branched-chain amino acid transport system II carrier protein [Anaerosphaera multitolerans]RVU54136.1 branched-chain amino acid transport system II carrier protein [Anaerosphaera multitolerans]
MNKKPSVVVSAMALFSMFFGAGNLIFPPTLGLWSGDKYIFSILGFLLASVGIVMLGVIATTKAGGRIENIASKLGDKFSITFGTLIILAIGPCLAIPRTAATTYEIIQGTMYPNLNPLVSSIVFFALVLFFVLSPTNVIDTLGKYLTPALLIVLTIIIVKGIFTPLGTISYTGAENVFGKSFIEGYQTMDALAALVFTSIVIKGFKEKGVTDSKELVSLTMKSSIYAAIGLSLVYGGLLYIGATASSLSFVRVEKVEFLIFITNSLLGSFGKYALSAAISLACITTAVGLTSTVGDFFFKLFNNKINYNFIVVVSTVFSAYFAINGVETLVKVSSPILSALYPVAIVLIFLNLFPSTFANKSTHIGAVLGACLPTVVTVLNFLNIKISFLSEIKSCFPVSLQSFLWIVPVIILATIFTLLGKKQVPVSE